MSAFWAYADRLDGPGSIELSADEARHVTSRRLRVDDPVTLFDGRGAVAHGRLEAAGRKSCVVSVEDIERHDPPNRDFTLASAIPKGDRVSTLLQMLSQLGVLIWQPLILDDSVVRKLDPENPRLRRILIESAKLARRPWALEIKAPLDLETALSEYGASGRICFGDREGATDGLPAEARLILIGPEAGFSDSERRRLLEVAAEPVSLSPYNLRIETAAIAAATARNVSVGSSAPRAAEESAL